MQYNTFPLPSTSTLRNRFAALMLGAALLITTGFVSGCGIIPGTSTTTSDATYNGTYYVPNWAPTSENLSQVRYYYFPDMNLFYDASTGRYMSMNNGTWTSSSTLPAAYSGTNLNNSYVVLLGPSTTTPWSNYSYYQTNYPAYSYQPYSNIVTSNNMISNLPSGYSVVPRAYNEATDQVVFAQRDANGNYVSGSSGYSDVPMSNISGYMPNDARSYNYGAGVHHQ